MRKRLTYANVAATMALVFSMSGGALAAKHYLVSSTKQISPTVLKKLKGATGKTGAAGSPGAAGLAGKEGLQGKTGERGPSAAFSTHTEDVEFPSKASEAVTLGSLTLPAGNFVFQGKVLVNNNSSERSDVECRLVVGTTTLDEGLLRPEKEGSVDRLTFVVSGVATVTASTTAKMVCEMSSTSGDYDGATLTAIQVGSIN